MKEKVKKLKNWIIEYQDELFVLATMTCSCILMYNTGKIVGYRKGTDNMFDNLKDGFIKSCNHGLVVGLDKYDGPVEKYAEDSLCSMLIMHQCASK